MSGKGWLQRYSASENSFEDALLIKIEMDHQLTNRLCNLVFSGVSITILVPVAC